MNRNAKFAFGTAILTLLLVGVIAYRSIVVSAESERWVQHTDRVLLTLDEILIDAESSDANKRGFIIAGSEFYLQRYHQSREKLREHQEALRVLTADNPRQQQNVVELQNIASLKDAAAENVVRLRRTMGFEAAASAVRGGEGLPMASKFEAVVEMMRQEEWRLLAIRSEDLHRRSGQNQQALILGTLLGVAITCSAVWSVQRESSHRSRAERALAQSENRLSAILKATPDGIVVMTGGGGIVLVNTQAEHQFGYRREEMIGSSINLLLPGAGSFRIEDGQNREGQPHFGNHLSKGDAVEGEFDRRGEAGAPLELEGKRRDGSTFPAEIALSSLEDADGLVMIAAIRDITERKILLNTWRRQRRSCSAPISSWSNSHM